APRPRGGVGPADRGGGRLGRRAGRAAPAARRPPRGRGRRGNRGRGAAPARPRADLRERGGNAMGMRIGAVLRSLGAQSDRKTLLACARAAEGAGLDGVWVVDHNAIPPDDAEGSDGRYLDPLAALAFLAGATERVGLGTAVLILPYRPALPTAKWIATVQELSGERLRLGVGVGWMAAEFRALGVPRER